MEKMGGTRDIAGPVYYGGSRDELNEKLRRRDDEIDRLRDALERVMLHDPDRPGLHGDPIDILRSAVSEAKRELAKCVR